MALDLSHQDIHKHTETPKKDGFDKVDVRRQLVVEVQALEALDETMKNNKELIDDYVVVVVVYCVARKYMHW